MPFISSAVINLTSDNYGKFLKRDSSLYQEISRGFKKDLSWDTKVKYKSQGMTLLDTNLLSLAILLKQDADDIEKLCESLPIKQILAAFKQAIVENADEYIIDFFLESYPQLASLDFILEHDESLVKLNPYYTEKLLKPYLNGSIKIDAYFKLLPKDLQLKRLIEILELSLYVENEPFARNILDILIFEVRSKMKGDNILEAKLVFQHIVEEAVKSHNWAALKYIIDNNENYYNKYGLSSKDIYDILNSSKYDFKFKFVLSLLYRSDLSFDGKQIEAKYYDELSAHLPRDIHLISLFEANFDNFNPPEQFPSQGFLLLNYLKAHKDKIPELAKVNIFKQMLFEFLETGVAYCQVKKGKLIGSNQQQISILERYELVNSILDSVDNPFRRFFGFSNDPYHDAGADNHYILILRSLKMELATSPEFLQECLRKDKKAEIGELLYLFLTETKLSDREANTLPENYIIHLANKPGYKKALWEYIKQNAEPLKNELLAINANKNHPLNQFLVTTANRYSLFNHRTQATSSTKQMTDLCNQLINGEKPIPSVANRFNH